MRQWFIKTFRKKVAVKIYLLHPDNRQTVHWFVPKGRDEFRYKDRAYKITPDTYVLQELVPTYYFNELDPAPINMERGTVSEITSKEYKLAIDTHVARDIFNSAGGKLSTESLIIIGVLLIGFLVVGYLNYDLSQQISSINETLRSLGIQP